jgi:hypothetical protein
MPADGHTAAIRHERVWLGLSLIFIAGGAALRLPAIDTPFVADDFAQRAMLHGTYPVHRSPLDLYNFAGGSTAETQALMNGAALPWWSHPHVKYAMLRPLSSALLWLDDTLMGARSFAAHTHSMLWWVATASAVAWLLRSLFPGRVAAMGTLFFVLHEAHTWPVVWLANRNALVSAAFGALALKAYVRWRELGIRRDAIVASTAFGLSCLGGEMGLCFAAYVVAYELVAARGNLKHRVAGLLPALAPFVFYAVLYRALGRGAFGSDVYLDPVSEPGAFARAAGPRMLALLSDLMAGTPAEKWSDRSSIGPLVGLVIVSGAIIVTAFVCSARFLERRAATHARWLALGAPLAILPVLASFVTARLLLPAAVGACAAFAVIVEGALRSAAARSRRASGVVATWLLLLAGGAVLYVHAGLAARRSRRELDFWKAFYEGLEAGTAGADLDRDRLSESTVVLLTAADPHTLLYGPSVWQAFGLPKPRRWRVLSIAQGPHVVARVADDTIELSALTSELLTMNFETLFRPARARMHLGDVVRLDDMTATVRVMGDVGPKVVRFRFDRSLDAPTMTLLVADGGELRRFHPPAIGAAEIIGPATIPMRLRGR